MTEQRPMLFLLLAFATSLGALSAAAGSAALRCGSDSDCSYQLALAVVAFAPACLIGILVVLLMRVRAEVRWLRTLLLAVGVGVAVVPLATFLLRDVKMLPPFAALMAALVLLVLWGEREASETERAGREAAAPPSAVGAEEPAAEPVLAERRRPALGRGVESTLAVLEQVASLNSEIIRLCELLPRAPQPNRVSMVERRSS